MAWAEVIIAELAAPDLRIVQSPGFLPTNVLGMIAAGPGAVRRFMTNRVENQMLVPVMQRDVAELIANGQPLTFHWALIRDENDSLAQAREIAALLRSYDFADARFSIVRYNAHPRSHSREATPERMREVHDILSAAVRSSKIISRVGYEAYASCGMFPADDVADD